MSAPPEVRLVDKPVGMTSHDVVGKIRREYSKGTRVGHAGTLDPFASGLLLVLIGRATRTQRFFMGLDKEYLTTARFGATSTTGDPEGEITVTGVIPHGDLLLPTGPQEQTPPKFSALKVGGKRAYSLARAGAEFELESRSIDVSLFQETRRDGQERDFRIRCSSGTYVRSLISDLGDAYCTQLRRTEIGPFRVPERGSESLPLRAALEKLFETSTLNSVDAQLLANGRRLDVDPALVGTRLAIGPDGVVAIASVDAEGVMSSLVGFVG